MHASRLLRSLPVLLALLLSACVATQPKPAVSSVNAPTLAPPHDNLNATLWMQASAEYEASVRGIFAQARRQLDVALITSDWDALPANERNLGSGFEDLPPAIIVDLDETMIDNSPFQARNIRDDEVYGSARWLAWSEERRALALPGAREFARYAADRGVSVFYVSNRKHATEHTSTIDNLLTLGFPLPDDRSTLLLKGDPRAPVDPKSARRGVVGAGHRVLLMLGDQLGDFVDPPEDRAGRQAAMAAHAGWWGERWFMLPNPAYGDWEVGLSLACDPALAAADRRACVRSQLRMD